MQSPIRQLEDLRIAVIQILQGLAGTRSFPSHIEYSYPIIKSGQVNGSRRLLGYGLHVYSTRHHRDGGDESWRAGSIPVSGHDSQATHPRYIPSQCTRNS